MKFFQRLLKPKETIVEKEALKISDFESVNNFWEFITKKDKWYLEYLPQQFDDLKSKLQELAPLIIETTNGLRYNLNFKNDDYWMIIPWDNLVLDLNLENNLKQYCANCKNEIKFLQRYPKLICKNCRSILTSSDKRRVEFFNSESLGYGCQGYYCDTNQTEKYNTNECYIDDKVFIAEEGRFGGIVIELKDQ